MRITNRMMIDTVTDNLMRVQTRMDAVQNQLTSGNRISRPSDDPLGTSQALAYRARQDATNQYLRTIDSSLAWVHSAEAPISSATQLLQRAKELAIQGSNETLSSSDQAAIAGEVDGLLQNLVQLGNTSVNGQRVFAGTTTDADPLTLNAGPPTTVTYSGNSGPMLREIDVGQTINIATPGTFLPGVAANLISLRDHLLAGDAASVRTTDLTGVDSGLQQVLNVQTQIGVTTNRLEGTRDRHLSEQIQIAARLSEVQDVDFAAAASEFALQETVYKAALAVSAKAIQPSLLDYLR